MFSYKTIFTSVISFSVCAGLFFLLYGFNPSSEQTNEQTNPSSTSAKVKPLASKINSIKSSGKTFSAKELFRINENAGTRSMINGYLKNFTSLKLDGASRDRLLNSKDENIVFRIPAGENKFMELELTKENVVTNDFKSGTLSGNGTVNYTAYTPGLYYRGIIKGDNESFASLSIFNDFVMMVASNKEGNWNLSSLKGANSLYSENYVLYNDAALINRQDFKCDVNDDNNAFDKRSFGWNNGNTNSDNPPQLVRKYFECDFKMYQDFGNSTVNVTNYVTAVFNSCIAMYAQDSINTVIQQTFVWITADPYMGLTDNTRILKLFGGRLQNTINGDLAHWVSTRTDISGGVAWLGVLCDPFNAGDSSGRYAVSVIDNMFVPFPAYSWVVNVVVHEMGHNLGSNHTFWCGWPGGAIDSCFAVEGACYAGPLIPRVGTVMSYCHLNATINLGLGFGHFPGDTIRAHVRRAACLPIGIEPISSEIPNGFSLSQNYPNPFNPTTKIQFSIPVGTGRDLTVQMKVFDILGSEVATLVNDQLQPGTYEVDWDGSGFASGIYYYKLISGDFSETKKMVLIK